MIITNNQNISLIAAVWLLDDNYDHVKEENYFSITTLMKPPRMVALRQRMKEPKNIDLSNLVANSFGSSLHDGVEASWRKDYRTPMRRLGYTDAVIDRIAIDPTDDYLAQNPDCIPLYFEQRSIKDVVVDGVTYKIGGKYDRIADGYVGDNKSTSVFSFDRADVEEDHTTQLSAYRWLNPDKVTKDVGYIDFFFTDWQAFRARQSPDSYPQCRIVTKPLQLWSMKRTEDWIINRIRLHRDAQNQADQATMVRCTPTELWMSKPEYKYYSDPAKAAQVRAGNGSGIRATKNCETLIEAQNYKLSKGGKGDIVETKPEVKRCGYCDAFPICTQKDEYL